MHFAPPVQRQLFAVFVLAAGTVFASCAPRASGLHTTTEATNDRSRPKESPPAESPLVAIVDGRTVDFAALRPALVEIAGQQALRDAVLDLRLARRLERERITLTPADIDRERALLLETLSPDPSRAVELLGAIRLRQGLGSTRFDALLARNAGLRTLVAPAVRIDETGLANAFDMLHGPKRVARMAVLSSLADADRFAADVAAGGDFVDLAVLRSLDEGAARGGLLAPLARRDPSYPEGLRAAIFATPVGGVSPPILDESRFYIVTVVEARPADGTSREAAHARCEQMLRLSRERLLMDALARELSSLDGVTVFDRSFDAPAR
jgi:hypothetical protein